MEKGSGKELEPEQKNQISTVTVSQRGLCVVGPARTGTRRLPRWPAPRPLSPRRAGRCCHQAWERDPRPGPVAPAILGAILGPELELQFRRALTLSNGNLGTFIERPLTVVILLLALLALLLPYLPKNHRQAPRPLTATAGKLSFGDED